MLIKLFYTNKLISFWSNDELVDWLIDWLIKLVKLFCTNKADYSILWFIQVPDCLSIKI